MKEIDDFFKRNNFDYKIDIEYAASILLEDMKKGLESEAESVSSMDMIPLWKNLPTDIPKDKKVIILGQALSILTKRECLRFFLFLNIRCLLLTGK